MAIHENALLGTIFVETSPNTGTATWTNQTATLVNADLSRAGQENYVGLVQGEIGTGSFTFFDNTSTILPGYWIRLRVAAGNIWSGYVVNVSETVTFVNPDFVIMKRVMVADWVSYVSQMNLGPVPETTIGSNKLNQRATALNTLIGATGLITGSGSVTTSYKFTELPIMPVSQALDISANSVVGGYWKSTTASPVSASSRAGLVKLAIPTAGATATFTDGTHTGSPSNLCYYTTLDVSNDSSEIANSITITNISNKDYDFQNTWAQENATSITNYGKRFAEFDSGITTDYLDNMIPNPNLSHSADYFGSGNANLIVNRQLLTDMSTGATGFLPVGSTQPWSYGTGNYVGTGRVSAITPNVIFRFGGTEFNGTVNSILVRPSTSYSAFVMLRTAVGQANVNGTCQIRWYDINGATISTVVGTSQPITVASGWIITYVTATSPANAYTAEIFGVFSTISGANNTNNRYFVQSASLRQIGTFEWVSGDAPDTTTYLYDWLDGEGQSTSLRWDNKLDVVGNAFLTANSTSYRSPRAIQWNVQQNLAAVDNIDTYDYVDVWFQGTKWTQLVTGITHQLDQSSPSSNRWLMRISLRPTA